jgi:alpha-ketoglutaric semialdehyde dehydrogenase
MSFRGGVEPLTNYSLAASIIQPSNSENPGQKTLTGRPQSFDPLTIVSYFLPGAVTPMSLQQVLIAGQWRDADATGTFRAENPATGEPLGDEYPVSSWSDCDLALASAAEAAADLSRLPVARFADFLTRYAARIQARADELVDMAHLETAYPKKPRLADVELPRTTDQLRQAAAAALEGSWSLPTIDSRANIRSYLAPLGPVCVFGPNNFPFAFGSASGGDFASAIATGNPVIAKANTSHPGTTRLFAEEAQATAEECQLPRGTVQLIYRTGHSDGARLVANSRLGASAYTGSRTAGLTLKAAADSVGKPIYLELSSSNPVVILPGAIEERSDQLVQEFCTSCLMGTGQFCTNPGLVLLLAGPKTENFIGAVARRFEEAAPGVLLSSGVLRSLEANVRLLISTGAELVTGGKAIDGPARRFANTLLRVPSARFIANPEILQTEAFGNATLFVVAENIDEAAEALSRLEGNLTGCIYSHTGGQDDSLYEQVSAPLRSRVGRLLNDKMPTGVAVSPAMNHGGPFPSTGHPGFTAVGIPASLRRFGMLQCFDNVRPDRLPPALGDKNPNGQMWRLIDGVWTQGGVVK